MNNFAKHCMPYCILNIQSLHSLTFLITPYTYFCSGYENTNKFIQCGEQGEGILVTWDIDSTLNQGQRPGENKTSAKKFYSFDT